MGRAAGCAGWGTQPAWRARTRKKDLFEAFRLILEDPALLDPAREAIFGRRRNAEQAVDEAIRGMAGRFRDLADPYARERAADILDLGQRVLRRLRRDEPGVPSGAGESAPLPAGRAGPAWRPRSCH